jgi:fucose 4-O-acetylase-like acetyltransferase
VGFLVMLSLSVLIADTKILSRIFIVIGENALPIYGFHVFILNYYRLCINKSPFDAVQIFATSCPWLFYIFYVLIAVTSIIFISKVVFEKNKILRRVFLGV